MSLLTKRVQIMYEPANPQLYKFNGNIMEISHNNHEGGGHSQQQLQYVNEENKISLDEKNILLRGCILRNTKWIYGVVIYAGHETKIMLNGHTPDIKQSKVGTLMNKLILFVCLLQSLICLFSSIYSNIWYHKKQDQLPYLFYSEDDHNSSVFISIIVTGGVWLMSIINFVPIALLVSIEMIRFFQGILISREKLMKSSNGFEPSVQSSNLNEDLGQIECIFSDKTGTLTCNIMNFKCLFVNGRSYGRTDDVNMNSILLQPSESMIENENVPSANVAKETNTKNERNTQIKPDELLLDLPDVPNVNFNDQKFFKTLNTSESPEKPFLDAMLLHLSLCHSVILTEKPDPEKDDDDSKPAARLTTSTIQDFEYQAASPDDLALVNFAKYAGYEYRGTDAQDIITIIHTNRVKSIPEESQLRFQVLHVLEFSSDRKRMSIIHRDLQTNKIHIFMKGADSIVLSRLDQKYYKNTEEGKLEVELLSQTLEDYSIVGLRTLLLASRELSSAEFDRWDREYKIASASLVKREEQMDVLQDQIERGMHIVGATAIEDKLQDDVQGTIQVLKDAGILFWILTGDKKETAINIGLSTKVLDHEDRILTLESEGEHGSYLDQLHAMLKTISDSALRKSHLASGLNGLNNQGTENNNNNNNQEQQQQQFPDTFSLVVTGEVLAQVLGNQTLSNALISVGTKCKSVIACRVSPKQKKDIVTIYKNSEEGKGKRTLAIGDGANDVNMITEAHIGIGIKGLEGMQAARSSDYAIGEFKILRRLLLFHGRECYRRNSIVILFNFYKNAMYLMPLLYFGFSSGFSGANFYDIYIFQLFNAIFTSFPIIFFAVFDRNLSSKILVRSPQLYRTGIENRFLNKKQFLIWFSQGFFHSAMMYFVVMFSLDSVIDLNHTADLTQIGQLIFMLAVLIANFKVIVHTNLMFPFTIVLQCLSIGLYLTLEILVNFYLDYDLYNILARILVSPCSYLIVILVLFITIGVDHALNVYIDFLYFMKLADFFKLRLASSSIRVKSNRQTLPSNLKALLHNNADIYEIRKTLKADDSDRSNQQSQVYFTNQLGQQQYHPPPLHTHNPSTSTHQQYQQEINTNQILQHPTTTLTKSSGSNSSSSSKQK